MQLDLDESLLENFQLIIPKSNSEFPNWFNLTINYQNLSENIKFSIKQLGKNSSANIYVLDTEFSKPTKLQIVDQVGLLKIK